MLAHFGSSAVLALFLLTPLLAFLPASSSELPTLVAPVSGAATPTPPTSPSTQPPAEPTASIETPSAPASEPKVATRAPGSRRTSVKAAAPKVKGSSSTPAVRRPTTVAWPATQDAVVYNVIFVVGNERVDVWTETNRLALDDAMKRNFGDKRDYTWFAYPGFRDGASVRYGDLAAHGQVRITRGAIPKTQPPNGGQTR